MIHTRVHSTHLFYYWVLGVVDLLLLLPLNCAVSTLYCIFDFYRVFPGGDKVPPAPWVFHNGEQVPGTNCDVMIILKKKKGTDSSEQRKRSQFSCLHGTRVELGPNNTCNDKLYVVRSRRALLLFVLWIAYSSCSTTAAVNSAAWMDCLRKRS